MSLRFRSTKQKQVFVVVQTSRSVDITPFDTRDNAMFAALRYVRKNRDKWPLIPKELTNESLLSQWSLFTDERIMIFESPIWTLEEY